MTGMGSEEERWPAGICSAGTGGGPNRPVMGVGGED